MKSSQRSVPSNRKPNFGKQFYRLSNPTKQLNAEQYEQVLITAEDLRFLSKSLHGEMLDFAPDIRAKSVVLRRLLCDGDLFKVVNLSEWNEPLQVNGRLLLYAEPDPLMVVSSGHYRWGNDTLPGISIQYADTHRPDKVEADWSYKENAAMLLTDYLDSLAFAITGTRVRKRDAISYIANTKAAHVSDRRKKPAHTALDHAWFSLNITRIDPEGNPETLNVVYLELLSIITALAESENIKSFVDHLEAWLRTAEISFGPEVVKRMKLELPMEPIK